MASGELVLHWKVFPRTIQFCYLTCRLSPQKSYFLELANPSVPSYAQSCSFDYCCCVPLPVHSSPVALVNTTPEAMTTTLGAALANTCYRGCVD